MEGTIQRMLSLASGSTQKSWLANSTVAHSLLHSRYKDPINCELNHQNYYD